MSNAKIKVDGTAYSVTESLGYQGGHYAKVVETDNGERKVVKRGGIWTWWAENNNRVAELAECLKAKKPRKREE